MYYLIKAKYHSLNDRGKNVTKKEEYLVNNCIYHAEAEQKGYEYSSEYQLDDFDVTAVKRSNIREFVNEDDGYDNTIYQATIVDIFLTDDGVEKETKYYVGIYAQDINDATKKVKEYMQQGIQDMRLIKVEETKIQQVL